MSETATVSLSDEYEAFRVSQREEISRHLLALTAHRGFSGVNVTDLTRAASLSRKTFYKYFPSIEAALVHAQQYALGQLSRFAPALSPGASGLECYLRTFQTLLAAAVEEPDLIRFISFFDFGLKKYTLSEDDAGAYESYLDQAAGVALDAFLAGQADGSIAAHLDATSTVFTSTNAVLGLIQRVVNTAQLGEQPELTQQIVQREIDMWHAVLVT